MCSSDLPGDEDIVITEQEAFKSNGFQFEYTIEREPGHRISLTTLPYSKNVTFSTEGKQNPNVQDLPLNEQRYVRIDRIIKRLSRSVLSPK